jgi:hypothetical protein
MKIVQTVQCTNCTNSAMHTVGYGVANVSTICTKLISLVTCVCINEQIITVQNCLIVLFWLCQGRG